LVQETELIGYKPILDAIDLALRSKYIRNENPVSLLLLSQAESGRTEAIKKFRFNDGIVMYRRFTAYGFLRDLIDGTVKLLFEKPRILPTIGIYDFNNLLNFKDETTSSTLEFVNAVSEEGLSVESTYAIRPRELLPFKGTRGNFIGAINTQGMFTYKRAVVKHVLYAGGFLSRPRIFSFDFSESLMHEIMDSLVHNEDQRKFVRDIPLKFPEKRVAISTDSKVNKELWGISAEVVRNINKKLVHFDMKGIRDFKAIRTLAKCSAQRDGRKSVNMKDVKRIRFISEWLNLEMNPLKPHYDFYDYCEGVD
jgi:hypothetical protein